MSEALDELVGLLRELRSSSAGVLTRAATARRILRQVAGLQPLERRGLMLEVAARAAPDVADRLASATGVEVTTDQLTALVDVLSQLEGDDLAELADRLEATAEGPAAEPAPAVPTEPVPQPEPAPASEPEPALEPEPAPEPEPEPEPQPDLEPEPMAVTEPEPVPAEPAATPEPDIPAEVAPSPPEPAGERSWFTGRPLGIAGVATGSGLVDRLTEARSGGVALRMFRAAIEDVAAMPGVAQATVLRAIPDGWARRRALEQLVRAGAVARADIPILLATLSGRWPRTWVVGTLLENGMVEPERLDELVDRETAGRLRRRAESGTG